MGFPLIACPIALADWQAYMMPASDYLGLVNGTLTAPRASVQLGPGSDFLINEIAQGFDMAGISSKDEQYPRGTGEIIGLDVTKGRDIELHLWSAPLTRTNTIYQDLQQLANAFLVGGATESPFWLKLPNYPILSFMVRTRRRKFPVNLQLSAASVWTPSLQLHATDPIAYSPVSVISTGSSGGATGLVYPVTYPLAYNATTTAVTVTNGGNWPIYPIVTLYGPLTLPSVDIGGLSVVLDNGLTPTIPTGGSVTLDYRVHSVSYTAPGQSAVGVPGWVTATSVWTSIAPGSVQASLTASGGVATGAMRISYAGGYYL